MNIEVFSDAICPWCWIGKRRLAKALAMPGCEDVTVTWRAYQLYPGIPEEGMERDAFMKARFGQNADRSEAWERLRQEGEREGLDMQFGKSKVVPNTLHAHRLERWAHVQGGAEGQDRMVETLFAFNFTRGEDLGDKDVLAAAAGEAGFDPTAARAWLETDEGASEVRYEVQWSRENGITGVPCFVLPNGFGVPGAQDAETLARFIRRGKELVAEAPRTA
ncbi:MAG: DsbA family oxidoreductase [Pseudomonadales bacterium]|jgi:predicted DsbA family dithiol-disulfide isomerase|nr:DsbA family oxidoreductase [Pseudomonadales bacterium]